MRRLFLLLAIALPASAYYHFIHYLPSGNAPEKYNLATLPGKTVTFYVSEDGPGLYTQNDTFSSVLSQIRQATQVWNGVATSDLRVAFGGLENSATLQKTPGGDVVFEDLQPGVGGYGTVTSLTTPVTLPNGSQFFPIVRSTVQLNRNLTLQPGPSYQESFYLTLLHEMGHALGLQHTFTSSTMSQSMTSATTLSHPLTADDAAALSVLYPNAAFAQMGSITGRITSAGKGVHLSSVVAIAAGADAVSALTNPDGSFRIDGIPPGVYSLYAHTLPPTADIQGPWNANGGTNPASGPTTALFYPGTNDPTQAAQLTVSAGRSVDGINLDLAARATVELYDIEIFGYLNNSIPVQPAFLNMLNGPVSVTATGTGLGTNGKAPGLTAQIIGTAAYTYGVVPAQANGQTYASLYIAFRAGGKPGPQHLVFTTPDYMYVLPSGFTLTRSAPPAVGSVTNNGDGTATVTGTSLAADSLIYFDGLPAVISSLDLKSGTAIVTPPPGANSQTSSLTIYNSDGQNSQLIQSAAPVTYSYGNTAPQSITSISPASLPAGAEALVDITTSGFTLVPGQITVGFGTTDVVVRRIFVAAPNHLQVDVSVSSAAALSNPDVSVMSGFQLATAPAAFQIAPAVPGLPAAIPVIENALPGLAGAYPGAIVAIYGTNLTAPNRTPSVTFNGQPALILYSSATQINMVIPQGLPAVTTIMNVSNGTASAYPLAVTIDPTPATIIFVQGSSVTNIDSTHPAHEGDAMIVSLTNFSSTGENFAPSRVQVGVGGTLHNATTVGNQVPGVYQVSFRLNANETIGTAQPLIVYTDGRSSYPTAIPVVP